METDNSKWSLRMKLWAILAACGSLAPLLYQPWYYRSQSTRSWIFEEQGRGHIDVSRLTFDLLIVLIISGLIAILADFGWRTFRGSRLFARRSIITSVVMALSIIIAVVSTTRAYQLGTIRDDAMIRASIAERALAACVSPNSPPPGFVLDPPPEK